MVLRIALNLRALLRPTERLKVAAAQITGCAGVEEMDEPNATAPSVEETSTRRKSAMDRAVDAVASGLGNGAGFLATSGIAFVVFGVLWLAFAVGLIWSQGSVDAAWDWLRGLPVIAQGVVWLLFLPVTAGLWIWETSWPVVLRLVLVACLAGWSLLIFFPRAASAGS